MCELKREIWVHRNDCKSCEQLKSEVDILKNQLLILQQNLQKVAEELHQDFWNCEQT